MKETRIIRKVDNLGRVVLPADLRHALDIAKDESLDVYIENDAIVLKKYNPTCVFCGSNKNTKAYKNKVICEHCLADITNGKFDD
ncbi:MAG: AbrB/MazE/SpoVT family DNA-binding domain-containing protein [Clostridia bacterium]|nr:AbrB/MazE/SpoVT family DNA-binding domain-containing protein [Clostridia bacterium]